MSRAETGAQEFHAGDGSIMSLEEWEKATALDAVDAPDAGDVEVVTPPEGEV